MNPEVLPIASLRLCIANGITASYFDKILSAPSAPLRETVLLGLIFKRIAQRRGGRGAEFGQDFKLLLRQEHNDVVNPAARTDAASPIYGMTILDADKAKNVIVIKRGRGVGVAGIGNALFYNPKTRMLFGDAKKALQELVTELKAL